MRTTVIARWRAYACVCVGLMGSTGLGQPVFSREPVTSLAMPLTPASFGYASVPAFPGLNFTDPVAIATPPGETNQVFVVEQAGIISAITNLAAPTRTVFLNLIGRVQAGGERGLLGLAFHPGYSTNREFYVFYTLNSTSGGGSGLHNRLSRFFVREDDPHRADPDSEFVLLNQFDQASNHNGGDIHFGPDGYLYVALGDEGGGNDTYSNSQRIDKDFFAGILRIDVDLRQGNRTPNPHAANTNAQGGFNYSIPADNPFVGVTTFNNASVNPDLVRTEFWAVGMRNPWRMSFDRETGLLYSADVGQDRFEEVNIVERGGNYGWSYREGYAAGPRGNPPAGTMFKQPILAYSHGSGQMQGFSITGGVVYRGTRLPELFGAYIFADYVSGNVWATRYGGSTNTPFWRLMGNGGIAGFGIDPSNGDVLTADQSSDTIERLIHNTVPVGTPLPATLTETGAFQDLAALVPAPGIVPYEINHPFWSDGASKQRWFSAPGETLFGFSETNNWTLPSGAVWVKNFTLRTNDTAESERRLETRFIVKNATGVYGVTYRWDESGTNATLVPEAGADEPILVTWGGITRTQIWHYPSRTECVACHTPEGGFALGFNTPQLNRDFTYDGGRTNQLIALADAGYLNRRPPPPATLPLLAGRSDTNFSISHRVRSYLAANCAQCHQPTGGARGFWDARFTAPADLGRVINVPLNNSSGDDASRAIVPGDAVHSEILRRISFRGPGQMPPIASNEIDHEAVALVSQWITNQLAGYVQPAQSYGVWVAENFQGASAPDTSPGGDPDLDRLNNVTEYLYGRDPLDPASTWSVQPRLQDGVLLLYFTPLINRGGEVIIEHGMSPLGPWTRLPSQEYNPFFDGGIFPGRVELGRPDLPAGFYRVRFLDP